MNKHQAIDATGKTFLIFCLLVLLAALVAAAAGGYNASRRREAALESKIRMLESAAVEPDCWYAGRDGVVPVRAVRRNSRLEVWKKTEDGRFERFETLPNIQIWSSAEKAAGWSKGIFETNYEAHKFVLMRLREDAERRRQEYKRIEAECAKREAELSAILEDLRKREENVEN